jgi:DNA-binding response OmpR family regulator
MYFPEVGLHDRWFVLRRFFTFKFDLMARNYTQSNPVQPLAGNAFDDVDWPVKEAAAPLTASAVETDVLLDPLRQIKELVPRSAPAGSGSSPVGVRKKLGLLEDNPVEAEAIAFLLERDNFEVVICSSGVAFYELLQVETFDFLVLDWNVPDLTGFEILTNLRLMLHLTTPVLMLTSRASEYDIVQALNAGADDYMLKPWKPFELLARINAILRRHRQVRIKAETQIGDFILDPLRKQIIRGDKAVELSAKEFALAQFLLHNLGSPVSRTQIFQAVWNGTPNDEKTLDVYISRIRSKLDLTAASGYRISSVYGYGYRLESLNTAT